jgi:hypothetical protein
MYLRLDVSDVLSSEAFMKKTGWFSWLSQRQPSRAFAGRVGVAVGVAILSMTTGGALAQAPAPDTQPVAPAGYTLHESVDLGGHMTNVNGSGAMYDTLVNMDSGPRVLGETFQLRALPGTKNTLVDSLTAFGSGFGGDPNNFARVTFYKGNLFDFSGLFRRDRQYFDYDLLGNPNIVPGKSIPIGPAAAPTGALAWPQVRQSPVMFNTVRRMTDTNLTLMPLSKFSYRVAYSHNTFEGPALSPSYTIFKYDALLRQYQRNGSDDYTGALDWKPVAGTRVTFEENVNRYKSDTFFTLNPNAFMVQEANGTKVDLGNWDSETPYGSSACNANSIGTTPVLSAPQTPGGLPVINPACAVVTGYLRTQPTRITIPTSIVRFQSSSIAKITMNGDFRYTLGTMNMPHYYENAQGLNGITRSTTWSGGYAKAHRAVVAADYGIVWQATDAISISDQFDYSSAQQPGYSNIPLPVNLNTPTTAGNETINYSGPLTAAAGTLPHGIEGFLYPGYFGQSYVTNHLTLSWDATSRTSFSLTYRYTDHKIGEGVPHGVRPVDTANDPFNGTVEIKENAGILGIVVRPATNWDVNATAEIGYSDSALTPVAPRQLQRYRVHTTYKPKSWMTVSGAFTDLERHNNTFNTAEDIAAGGIYYGPINHVDHTRIGSFGASLTPSQHYGFDLNYVYDDVYTATNTCFTSGAAAGLPGAATLNPDGTPAVCPGVFARGSTTVLVDWRARSFEDMPVQYGSASIHLTPTTKFRSDLGYRIDSSNGTRFYQDARDVAGALVSTYQQPFVDVAYTMHPGFIWKAEYNFYGYGEGGPSGAQYCSLSTGPTASVVPCTSLPYPTGRTEPSSGLTAPRNFHANNVTLGFHYEF